jgi:hypothetical protein
MHRKRSCQGDLGRRTGAPIEGIVVQGENAPRLAAWQNAAMLRTIAWLTVGVLFVGFPAGRPLKPIARQSLAQERWA